MNALRTSLGTALLATLVIFAHYLSLGSRLDILSRSHDLILAFGAGAVFLFVALLVESGLLVAGWTSWKDRLTSSLERGAVTLRRLGLANLILFALGIGLFSFLLTSPYNRYLPGMLLRLSIAWLLCLAGAILLKSAGIDRSWGQCLLVAALLLGAGYRLAIFALDISIYPFSLGWSEASRYYYASLFLSERLYGISIPPSVLHPSRYLLQAAPFLIPDSPLWLHRAWQVFLWLASTLTTVGLLAKRLYIEDRFYRLIFAVWAALLVLMAPVYYHLQVTIILVLWGYQRQKPWRTLLVVLIASMWAGISRINWLPVPGMLAATLYFLEAPRDRASVFSYLSKPTLWVFSGTAVAYLSQEYYARLSGNPAELFGSSFSSQLLWYRLWPSATYPLGILPGALLVVTPALIAIYLRLKGRWESFYFIRWLGIGAILLALFGGGLIVSVKIGGGSNLHNLDAFLSLFLVVSAFIYFERFSLEDSSGTRRASSPAPGWIYPASVAAALVIPFIITLDITATRNLPAKEVIYEAIQTIQTEVSAATSSGGKALFISERQLIIFDTITEVEIVPDYEKVFLMEMAMADNEAYLSEFYAKLRAHEFSLIVSEPLRPNYQDSSHSFGEENNAWVKNVAEPILCSYEAKLTLRQVRVELLVPRGTGASCP
ncbi:MAG TPA: hypothetical protein VJL34_00545 [Anaerolineales bacterium]|nr:hypothetical protein [Anaerolineales bacterium]